MAYQYPHYVGITARGRGGDTVEVTLARLDPSSNRMVFEHLATLLGDLTRPQDAAQVLAIAAGEYLAQVTEPPA